MKLTYDGYMVNYYGLILYVPKTVTHVAVNADGSIFGYFSKPNKDSYRFNPQGLSLSEYSYVSLAKGRIVEGEWHNSCITLEQLLFKQRIKP